MPAPSAPQQGTTTVPDNNFTVPRGRTAPGSAPRGRRGFNSSNAARAKRLADRQREEMDKIQPRSVIGILAKNDKLDNINAVFADSKQFKESWIVKKILKDNYFEEKLASKSVQKQTRSGQSTKTKVTVAIGNKNGLVGAASGRGRDSPAAVQSALGKCSRHMISVRKGYWGDADSTPAPHTISNKVTGKCGSVRVRLIPAPPGRSTVANKTHTKILQLAGITDVFVKSKGYTSTRENHVKALLNALEKTYSFYPPCDWNTNNQTRSIADDALIMKNTIAGRS